MARLVRALLLAAALFAASALPADSALTSLHGDNAIAAAKSRVQKVTLWT